MSQRSLGFEPRTENTPIRGFLRFNDPHPLLADAAIDHVVREPGPDAHVFRGVHFFKGERVVLHEFVKVFSALFAGESLLVFVHRLRQFGHRARAVESLPGEIQHERQ